MRGDAVILRKECLPADLGIVPGVGTTFVYGQMRWTVISRSRSGELSGVIACELELEREASTQYLGESPSLELLFDAGWRIKP